MGRDRDIPILPLAVLVVIPLEVITVGLIVREHNRGIFERHAMLLLVGFGLSLIPFKEMVVSHRHLRPSGLTRYMLLPITVTLKPGLSAPLNPLQSEKSPSYPNLIKVPKINRFAPLIQQAWRIRGSAIAIPLRLTGH
jgi:hypothetical protein